MAEVIAEKLHLHAVAGLQGGQMRNFSICNDPIQGGVRDTDIFGRCRDGAKVGEIAGHGNTRRPRLSTSGSRAGDRTRQTDDLGTIGVQGPHRLESIVGIAVGDDESLCRKVDAGDDMVRRRAGTELMPKFRRSRSTKPLVRIASLILGGVYALCILVLCVHWWPLYFCTSP